VQTRNPEYDAALHDAEYDTFSARLRETFSANVGTGKPVFTTDVDGLFQTYLDHLPPEQRQVHNCNTCRRFFDTYGALVTIDEAGRIAPAMWSVDTDAVPEAYRDAVDAMYLRVQRAPITGVFYSAERQWGTPTTGDWHHLHVLPPASMVHKDRLKTPSQAMAEKRHEHETLQRALAEFTVPHLQAAVNLLKTDALYRSWHVLGVAEFLLNLKMARDNAPSRPQRDAGTWLSVATAPAGFCHPRSSMIGTLLEDLAAGLPFEDVAAKFKAKMHPLQYQRPQAAPRAGNIEQAEKIVEKLGIAPALKRRFARLDDVVAAWRPAAPAPAEQPAGVFGHLKSRDAAQPSDLQAPPTTMTWDKFSRTVLPEARSIEVLVPSHGNFVALTTAVDAEAPPILQWDRDDQRNSVAWYVYNGGSRAIQWNLQPGWAKVNAIALKPHLWHSETGSPNHEKSIVAIIDGARDVNGPASMALFPETLKSELHGIRSTIEAFSRAGRLEGAEEASACGLTGWGITLRVTGPTGRAIYKLDRWD
jgi:hypothetical protein